MYLDRPIDQQFPTPPLRRSPSPLDDDADDAGEGADVSSLRRTHTTLGYRDGIAAAKPTHVQSGFDEAYPLGGRFGLKVGWIKGVLEGVWMLDRADEGVARLRREAEAELDLRRVFAREWFDEKGVWRYGLGGEGEEGEEGVTLDRVVERHPVVVKWVERVKEVAGRWGLVVEELVYDGEEGEGGLVLLVLLVLLVQLLAEVVMSPSLVAGGSAVSGWGLARHLARACVYALGILIRV